MSLINLPREIIRYISMFDSKTYYNLLQISKSIYNTVHTDNSKEIFSKQISFIHLKNTHTKWILPNNNTYLTKSKKHIILGQSYCKVIYIDKNIKYTHIIKVNPFSTLREYSYKYDKTHIKCYIFDIISNVEAIEVIIKKLDFGEKYYQNIKINIEHIWNCKYNDKKGTISYRINYINSKTKEIILSYISKNPAEYTSFVLNHVTICDSVWLNRG